MELSLVLKRDGRKEIRYRGRTKLISASMYRGFPGGLLVKNPPTSSGDAGDLGSVPRSERSLGEGNGYPLQYPCLENPMDREAWHSMRFLRIGHDWAHICTHTAYTEHLLDFLSCTSSSVQFSLSVVSDSLQPHESQHARPPCPSPIHGVYPNPCPLRWWCHPTISSSVIPFSSCPQSFLASGSFPMSQLFASGGQSIGVSASISVLPVNTQDWYPLGWTGWISFQSKGLLRVSSNTTVQKHQCIINILFNPHKTNALHLQINTAM